MVEGSWTGWVCERVADVGGIGCHAGIDEGCQLIGRVVRHLDSRILRFIEITGDCDATVGGVDGAPLFDVPLDEEVDVGPFCRCDCQTGLEQLLGARNVQQVLIIEVTGG